MAFIVILLALLVERFFDCSAFRNWNGYFSFQKMIATRVAYFSSNGVIAFSMLCVLFAVIFFNWMLTHYAYGLLNVFFQLLVVLYCLGPTNFWVAALMCVNACLTKEPAQAAMTLKNSFNLPNMPDYSNPSILHLQLLQQIFIGGYQLVAPVLFWYGCLGVSGAVIYKMIALFSFPQEINQNNLDSEKIAYMHPLKALLDWIPIRIFTFILALGGHFIPVFHCWRHQILQTLMSQDQLLVDCGLAALDVKDQTKIAHDGSLEKEAIFLIDRVFMIALSLLAAIMLSIVL